MNIRDRLIIAQPPGLTNDLARAAIDQGALALVDTTSPAGTSASHGLDPSRLVLRVGRDAAPTEGIALAMLHTWRIEARDVPALTRTVDAWHDAGVPVAVEVRSVDEGRRARQAGADLIVARGAEGPGRVSTRSNLVLVPALAELGLPLIAWGGAGPHATGALFVHADRVVLDAQLYGLPEAGLSDAWRKALTAFDGTDVKLLGSTLEEPFHVFARVAERHVHELWEREHALADEGPSTRRTKLRSWIDEGQAGFDTPPRDGLHPIGHDAAHAAFFAALGSLDEALSLLERQVETQVKAAAGQRFPLSAGSPIAADHGTEFPIVQGAMANVSEVPAFAKAVSDAGALPMLAFASLRKEWAADALVGTKELLGEDRAFGCGIIGLDVNAKKRDAHLALIREHRPPFALVAAGTAEQALGLSREGIRTYLHTPSQGVVKQALDMGLKRVVVEGSECGGHIGKLPSLVLWDLALQVASRHDDVRVLFAGGIADARTAAVAGTLAAGAPNVSVGVLMGTAYLATREIVETGAIPPVYQDLVLASKTTQVTGETVGIRARSAPTPFTERVVKLEHQLVKDGLKVRERKETLEHENLGACRIACRGLKRGEDGTYGDVPTRTQLDEGNYLMGQVAELLDERITVRELHERVTVEALERARTGVARLQRAPELPHYAPAAATAAAAVTPTTGGDATAADADGPNPRAIAVVGLGCVLPDAPDVPTFWDNVLGKRVSIRELPEGRWPVDPRTHLGDGKDASTYTVLGAFIGDDGFDPIKYRIPPKVADQMDGAQKWAIQATDQALQDAGLTEVKDRSRWGVLLGNALGGEQRSWSDRRLSLREALASIEESQLDDDAKKAACAPIEALLARMPQITEDTMPGELSNVIAGRICHVFDIGGPARTSDAACASTLAAVQDAVALLREGAIDVAITGGVDRSMDPAAYAKFSAIGALSRDGSFPFDEKASGFVMGEGCGILVLKRLRDAVADGDRIYAVVEGVGSSSDGKGKGITAPNPSGQERAVRSALADAGWEPSTLGFVEAHGTGTPVGDPVEAETLERVLAGTEPGSVALGSVKANIGHLKAAAGAAGLIKATLAIHHGVIPPAIVDKPTAKVDWTTSPLRLPSDAEPWTEPVRRAGVSAFGFGGTNSHVLLGNAPVPGQPGLRAAPQAAEAQAPATPQRAGAGARVLVVTGKDREAVLDQLDEDPATWRPDPSDPVRLAMSPALPIDVAKRVLRDEMPAELALGQGVALAEGEPGKLAMLFPGQGSQYAGMVVDLAEHFPAAQEVLDEADAVLTPLIGKPLSHYLLLDRDEGEEALKATEICQPAVLTCDIAILRILEEMGVEPDVVAGHSLGEYAALVAAGVLRFRDALLAVSARGREMANVHVDDPGGLVALRAGGDAIEPLIEGLEAWPANLNAPDQTVVAGTTPALEAILARAKDAGIQAARLPVSAAFHSPIVAPATEPLGRVLERIPFDPPQVPVIANVTGEPYPDDPAAVRELLTRQVASSVQWVKTLEYLADDGVGLVVEVGPKRVLTNLAKASLPEIPAVPTAHPRTGAKQTLEMATLALAAHGRLDLPRPEPARPGPAQPERRGPAGPVPSPHPNGDGQHPRPARVTHPTQLATPGGHAPVETVVTGVSLGLPGGGDPFDPGAEAELLAGGNRITPVGAATKQRMVDLGITRLIKDAPGGPKLEPIDRPDQVVQLSGRLGDVSLADYDADADWLAHADVTARLAVVAALNALTDARIPLVREQRTTSTGSTLAGGWVLPEPLQAETGVILASAFPGYDSLIREVQARSRDHGPAAAALSAGRLLDAATRLAPHIETEAGKRALMDWITEVHTHAGAPEPARQAHPAHEARPSGNGEGPHVDPFPRDFLFRALGMGHAQLAQLVRAKGPNLHVNAACASTTAALATAQDWIRTGRCKRVIVIGADVAGNDTMLPWVGAGFLAAGAATTADRVDEAALPFDQRRHGMLVGSGAVALVVETAEAAHERGVEPLARLVDTHLANSAFHGARLEPDHVAQEVDRFVDRAASSLGRDKATLAKELVFVSHEPSTPARGGSAEAEVRALRTALGDAAKDVLITNVKGLTGHAMGAGLEDGIAVRVLHRSRAPPVANLQQVDPAFEDLTFSRGGAAEGRNLVLRFAAGFGSQVALALFERAGPRPGAVDEARFTAWVERVCGPGHDVRNQDRLLRAVAREATVAGPTVPPVEPAARTSPQPATQPVTQPATQPTVKPAADPAATAGPATTPEAPVPAATATATDVDQLVDVLVELVAERTGYPVDVIEPEMDLEGDLGVDTVKQAEVLAAARERFGIPPIEGLSLADVPTIRKAAEALAGHVEGQAQPPAQAPAQATPGASPAIEGQDEPSPADASSGGDVGPASTDELVSVLTELVAERTGYPVDVIEPEMDLEGDLGVDTVKQAEVLAGARERFGIPPIEGLSLADVPTIRKAAEALAKHLGPAATGPVGDAAAPAESQGVDVPRTETPSGPMPVLELTWTDATPAAVRPRAFRLLDTGTAPKGLTAALERAGAGTVAENEKKDEQEDEHEDEEGDGSLVIAPVTEDAAGVEPLVALLETLQGVPADATTVLVASAEAWFAPGLAALASTLTAEGRPARAVLVADAGLDEVAAELLRDTTESVRIGATERSTPALAPSAASREASARELEPGTVVLATGGLGAAVWPCLVELGRRHDGLRLAVVGRGPAEPIELDPDDPAAVDALRKELFAEAKTAGDLKPADVERKVQARIKQARRAQALAALGEVFAEVRYERVDATDADAVGAVVDAISRTWKPPALVVHGAGYERSRAFADKPRDEIASVLGAKLAPVLTLVELAPEAHHVAFGSIAGVHGNPMQADYALANGCLTGLLAGPDRGDHTVLHWTAWEAAGGMADDETIRTVLAERGVRYLDADEGARIFADGTLVPGARLVADLPPTVPITPTPGGARIVLAGDEPWLVDHSVSGRPLFPGVRHLEAVVTAARAHGHAPRGLSEVRFRSPLWVTEPVDADVVLDLEEGTAGTRTDKRVHATCRLDPGDGTKALEPEGPPSTGRGLDRSTLYNKLFHGPSFQVLAHAEPRDDGALVVALAELDVGGAAPWALALEACMQAAGVGEMDRTGTTLLPVGIEAVEWADRPAACAEAVVVARKVADGLTGATWDAAVFVDGERFVEARAIHLASVEGLGSLSGPLASLENAAGVTLRMARVEPHEPRDPRAKKHAQRAAGNDAAAQALRAVHGRDVELTRNDEGRPLPVEAPGGVSITHGHGVAIAAASADVDELGVDLERVEARARSFLEEAFTEDERGYVSHHALGPDATATLLWSLKEAAAKAIGTGLTVPVRELEVASLGEGTAVVVTPAGEVAAWWTQAGPEAFVSVGKRRRA